MYPFIVFAIFAFAIAAAWHELAFQAATEARSNAEQAEAQNFARFAVALHESIASPFFDHDGNPATAPVRAFAFSRDFIAHNQGGKMIYDESRSANTPLAASLVASIITELGYTGNFANLTADQQRTVTTAVRYESLVQTLYGCSEENANMEVFEYTTITPNIQTLGANQFCGFSSSEAKSDPLKAKYGYAAAQNILPWVAGANAYGFTAHIQDQGTPTDADDFIQLRRADGTGIIGTTTDINKAYSDKIVEIYESGDPDIDDRRDVINTALKEQYDIYTNAKARLTEFRQTRRQALATARARLALPDDVHVRAWLGCALEGGITDAQAITTIPEDRFNIGGAGGFNEANRDDFRTKTQRLCGATKTTNPLALIVWLESNGDGDISGLEEGAIHAELQKLLPTTTRIRFGIGKLTSTDVVRTILSTSPVNRGQDHDATNQPATGLGTVILPGFPTPVDTPRGTLPRQEVSGRSDTLTASLPYIFTPRTTTTTPAVNVLDAEASAQLAFYSVFPLAEGYDASDVAFVPKSPPPVLSALRGCPAGNTNGSAFDVDGTENTNLCYNQAGLETLND